jgi:hypothetical protein
MHQGRASGILSFNETHSLKWRHMKTI